MVSFWLVGTLGTVRRSGASTGYGCESDEGLRGGVMQRVEGN